MKKINIRWSLFAYDALIFLVVDILLLLFYQGDNTLSALGILEQVFLSFLCIFSARFVGDIYHQIWRYGGIQCYIRLLLVDGIAFLFNLAFEILLPMEHITFVRLLSISCLNLLGALAIRMVYRYAYKCGNNLTVQGKVLSFLLRFFSGEKVQSEKDSEHKKIKIAIIGAGRVGVSLAEELLNNAAAAYVPCCFIDINREKTGRSIHDIPVLMENEGTLEHLKDYEIQEIVFAIPTLSDENKKRLHEYYSNAGYKTKVYDYPIIQSGNGKRYLREFDIEDLLFRKPVGIGNEMVSAYYRDKVILITGGGGSIGSELCRQIAKMKPKQIIILDICENGAYDIQQELKIIYKDTLDVRIEIVSITNKAGTARIFDTYHPQIVLHAAAHKHVPLMEHNCIEAVENNVFGTKNLVELCEEYAAERFIMVSTDKAVNSTSVMGATKRMCEMIVRSASTYGHVKYSTTRFGNVLGSAGSVIPLFKKQIASGGPVTITDKRITRYFMTITEASWLVLESGAMAENGELFVLDMGQPVKILDLAESMIRLSGIQGIEIVEIGLRPGEKLYEELLVKTENLNKTENSLIFIERDKPFSRDEIDCKLEDLRAACDTDDDEIVRAALKAAIPTYRSPDEADEENAASADARYEMKPEKATDKVTAETYVLGEKMGGKAGNEGFG